MSYAKVFCLVLAAAAALEQACAGLLGGGYGRGPAPGYFGGPAFGGGYYASGPAIPYNFQYGVRDGYSGNDFGQHESGDGAGNVKGQYQVRLPDGRNQVVTYSASDATGYVADVQYQGTPHFPAHAGGPGPFGPAGYRAPFGGLSATYLPPHGK